jgi:hypothetical protein
MVCRTARKFMSENDKYLKAFPLKLKPLEGNQEIENVKDVAASLDKHESICEIRHRTINARLRRIEFVLMATAAMLITILLQRVGVL